MVARCTTERLMRELENRRSHSQAQAAAYDCLRVWPVSGLLTCYATTSPGLRQTRRWVTGITHVDTASGFVYTSFVTDLFARKIAGWQLADYPRAGSGSRRAGASDLVA